MPCHGPQCRQGRKECSRPDCFKKESAPGYGPNLPVPFYLRAIGVILALASLLTWFLMVTTV